MKFSGYWLIRNAKKLGKENCLDSSTNIEKNLNDNLKRRFDTDLKITKDETAFTDYYSPKRRNEIKNIFEENNPDCKQAAKLAFELISAAYMQFDL